MGVIAVSVQTAPARAAHTHCDRIIYSTNQTGSNPDFFPADYRPGGNAELLDFFQFLFEPPAPPPLSQVPDCIYELSDITSITINFVFTGTMIWDDRVNIGKDAPNQVIYPISPGSLTFTSGEPTVLVLDPHQTDTTRPGPFEDIFPYPGGPISKILPVTLRGGNNGFEITSASARIIGSHYYLPHVPGPLPLFGVGAAFGFSRRLRKRIKTRTSPEVMSASG